MFRGPSSAPLALGCAPSLVFFAPASSRGAANTLRIDRFVGDRRLLRATSGRVGSGFVYAPLSVQLAQAAPENKLGRLGSVMREHVAAIGQTALLSGYFRFFRVPFGPAQAGLLIAPLLLSAMQAILASHFGGGGGGGGGASSAGSGGLGRDGPLTRSRGDGGGGGGFGGGGGGGQPVDVARALEVISERIRAIEEWALKQEEIDGEFARRQVELLNAKLAPIHESYAVLEDRVEPLREEVARLAEAVERSNAALVGDDDDGRLDARLETLDVPRRGEVRALEAKISVLVDAVKSVTAQQGTLAAQMTDLAAALQGVVAQSASPRPPPAESPGPSSDALSRLDAQLRKLAEGQDAAALRFDALDVDMRAMLEEQRAAAERISTIEAQLAGSGGFVLGSEREERDLQEWVRSIEARLFARGDTTGDNGPPPEAAEAEEEEFEGTFGTAATAVAAAGPAGSTSITSPSPPSAASAPSTSAADGSPEFPYATRGSSSPSSESASPQPARSPAASPPPAPRRRGRSPASPPPPQRLSIRDVAYGFDRNPFVVGGTGGEEDDVWAPYESDGGASGSEPAAAAPPEGSEAGVEGAERPGWAGQIAGFFSTVSEAMSEPDRVLTEDELLYGSPLDSPVSGSTPAGGTPAAAAAGRGASPEDAAERASALREEALQLVSAAKKAARQWSAGEGLDARAREAARAEADALFERAFDLFERAVNLEPSSKEALWYWGTALLAQSKIKKTDEEKERVLLEAGGHYRALVVLDPRNVRALFNWGLALCYRARIRPEGGKDADSFYGAAVEKFQRALVYGPGMREALTNLGLALYNMAQGRRRMSGAARASVPGLIERASAAFQEALEAEPTDAMARNGVDMCREGLRAWRLEELRRRGGKEAEEAAAEAEEKA